MSIQTFKQDLISDISKFFSVIQCNSGLFADANKTVPFLNYAVGFKKRPDEANNETLLLQIKTLLIGICFKKLDLDIKDNDALYLDGDTLLSTKYTVYVRDIIVAETDQTVEILARIAFKK